MSLFRTPEEHAANPPETWDVVKVAERRWVLEADGATLQGFPTKREAEAARESGFYVNLYSKEGRWYAGEKVAGWKSYAELTA